MSECRNCGAKELEELGPIGRIAPFFLKRVSGIELRRPRTINRWRQLVRDVFVRLTSPLTRLVGQSAFIEMQLCSRCLFIQSKLPFHDDDIMRLYRDYRSPSYNSERIKYEPSYAAIADAVGHDPVELENRISALTAFLRRNLTTDLHSVLDYGGSDGRFIPDLCASKYVFEVSDIQPVAGVTRVHTDKELASYSLVLLAHVIEHVPYPLDLVRRVAVHVKPGGYLYIETPQEITDDNRDTLRSNALNFDIGIHEHINSYCMSAVSQLIHAAGLHVVAIESSSVDVGWATAIHIRALGQKPYHA